VGIEPKRGCGYRQIGGLYLCGDATGLPCDRLPFSLTVCPTCSAGFKRSRAPAWIDIAALFGGSHKVNGIPCACAFNGCPLCEQPEKLGKGLLLWVGTKFYPTTFDFITEGLALGFSRRIHALPKGFQIGKTFVLLAHEKAVRTFGPGEAINDPLWTAESSTVKEIYSPGIFWVWTPTRIEKILPESKRDTKEAAALVKRGIQPVFVPDNDRDHNHSTENEQKEPLFND
jgi:hypothetical protein